MTTVMAEQRDLKENSSNGAACVEGANEAWLRLCISEHGGAVYGTARRIVADAHIAEEVAQDAFIELWRRPERFDPRRGSLRTFLVVLARNKAVDAIRKLQPQPILRENIGDDFHSTVSPTHMTQIERRLDIAAALSELSEVQRQAVCLAFFGGLTYRQVGQWLHIPEGTAKTRIRDGLIRLRDAMGADERLDSRREHDAAAVDTRALCRPPN